MTEARNERSLERMTFEIQRPMKQQLMKHAKRHDVSTSQLLRRMVKRYLDQQEGSVDRANTATKAGSSSDAGRHN